MSRSALILVLLLGAWGTSDVPAPTRFVAANLMIDPGGLPLAAYEVEVTAEKGAISLVGVEQGDHAAYSARPPFYDPRALAGRRIIIGDYTLSAGAPRGRFRAARVMLEVRGPGRPELAVTLRTASDPTGGPIGARVDITFEGERQ